MAYKKYQRQGKKEYICSICREKFLRYEIHVLKRGKDFAYCSRKCNGIARSQKYIDENHPRWKGNKVGYSAIHRWISNKLGKAKICSKCFIKEGVEWANVSGKYKRDFNDWIQLCRRCHAKFDDYVNKSWRTRKKKYGKTGRKLKLQ